MLITFVLVMMGWIIFRATSMTQAVEYIVRMFSMERQTSVFVSFRASLWLIEVIMFSLCVEWWNRSSEHEFKKVVSNKYIRTFVYFILTASIFYSYMLSIEEDSTFIYFQF